MTGQVGVPTTGQPKRLDGIWQILSRVQVAQVQHDGRVEAQASAEVLKLTCRRDGGRRVDMEGHVVHPMAGEAVGAPQVGPAELADGQHPGRPRGLASHDRL